MRRMPLVMALFAGGTLAATGTLLAAQADASSDEGLKAKLDEAVKQLAAYDFGGDSSPLGAMDELVVATQGKPAVRKELAEKLAAVLAGGAPWGAKSSVCRQLAVLGTTDQVAALAALLTDENLSHMARYALERIPGPAADGALREALGKVKGKLLIGMVNSLGNRRSQSAVVDLARLLGDADPAVAYAAAGALGKIGPAAAPALEQALANVPVAVQRSVVDAYLLCADALVAEGQREQAVAIYDRLRQGSVPEACRVAATRGAILARQAAGTPLLLEQLKNDDPALFGLALTLVRYAPSAELAAAAAALGSLPPERRIRLVEALADRGDKVAMPAVLRLATAGDTVVRPAAIRALGRLGNAMLVPALLEMAAGGDAELAQAAMSGLAAMVDREVDASLLAALAKGDSKVRVAVIELLGRRRPAGATSALRKAAAEADDSVRQAAVKALASTAGPQDVAALVELLLAAQNSRELAAAQATLGAACARMRDREAAAGQLINVLTRAGVEAKIALLRSLGQISGANALAAVGAAIKDADPSVQDTAVRLLSDWQEAAAAPQLLTIAKTSPSPKSKILALRGYLRLIGHRSLPLQEKLAMCREAQLLVQRPEEKRLLLGALGGVPVAEALAMVVPCLDDPALKNEAAAAAAAIGYRLASTHPTEVAEVMKKALAASDNQDVRQRAQEVLDRTGKK